MYSKIRDFKTPKDIYNLLKFLNNFYDTKNLLNTFRFPSNNYKRKIFDYLEKNHFLSIDTLEYMKKYKTDDFDDFNDITFFKNIIYRDQANYSSTMLTDSDYEKITIYMSYFFSNSENDFTYFIERILDSTSSSINKDFLYSLVSENQGFKELETEEYMVSLKSTDIKEILDSLDALSTMEEENFIAINNIKNIRKFLEASL